MKKAVFIALLVAVAFAVGYFVGNTRKEEQKEPDTVIVRDTVEVLRVDTLRVTDTRLVRERVTDTVRVVVPIAPDGAVELTRVQRIFDGDNYRAWVSGLNIPTERGPWLDSINIEREVIEKTITINTQTKPKRWGVGVSAGITYDLGQKRPAPYIGVGVNYNLLTW